MNRCRRLLPVALLALSALFACKSVTSGVKWEAKTDAPTLDSRGDGCYVEVFELGNEPKRPYKVVGTLTLDLDQNEVREGAGAGVAKRFTEAACSYGVFMVKDIKTYPEPTSGRVLYEAKAAVFLDDQGRPILQQTHEEKKTADDAMEAAKAGAAEAAAAVDEATGAAATGATATGATGSADAGPAE